MNQLGANFSLNVFFLFSFVFIWDKWNTRPWNDHSEKGGPFSGLDENLPQSTFVPIVRNSFSDMGALLMEESCMQDDCEDD